MIILKQFNFSIIIYCFLVSTLFFSCVSIEKTVDQIPSFEITGRMHLDMQLVKNGCWVLLGDDGKTYELTGKKIIGILIEGIHVDLIVRGPLDLASVCEAGPVLEIVDILRDERKKLK